MLEKTMRMNYLFDFYQILLTERQKEYMQMYYLEDYSLVEIAKEANVSRQAVYDNIKRTETILETYESQLKLYEKFTNRKNLLNKLEKIIKEEQDSRKSLEIIHKLKDLG